MKPLIISLAIILGVGGMLFVAQSNSTKTTVPIMTIQTIQTDIKSGAQLIDVRTADEYAAGHIDGAINLSLQDMQSGTMPNITKDKTIYVYCHTGNRSGQATTILKASGYKVTDLGAITHVQSLGGIIK
ncbi:MAG: rhodanese-like domain-containing protein [Candidatus Saccharibacteria bacterium]